jgi:hypothetical protein
MKSEVILSGLKRLDMDTLNKNQWEISLKVIINDSMSITNYWKMDQF